MKTPKSKRRKTPLNPVLKKDLRSPKYKQRVVKDTHKQVVQKDHIQSLLDDLIEDREHKYT